MEVKPTTTAKNWYETKRKTCIKASSVDRVYY